MNYYTTPLYASGRRHGFLKLLDEVTPYVKTQEVFFERNRKKTLKKSSCAIKLLKCNEKFRNL